MTLIERHLAKRMGGGFLAALFALAGVIWVTRALNNLNVVTAKGQTLLIFLEMSALALPFLLTVIAPFALLIACLYVLNAASADSEIVVIAAAGGGRMRILRPVLWVAVTVALASATMSSFVIPNFQRTLTRVVASINADLIANIIQPGRFVTVDEGLTFHIRSKAGDGTLIGLVIDDRRDPADAKTYMAREATVIEAGRAMVLVMRNVTFIRNSGGGGKTSILFDTYGFDLSELAPQGTRSASLRPAERTVLDLITAPDAENLSPEMRGRYRVEIHERLSQALLSLAFAMVAFLFLGDVKTTRQGRGLAILGAVLTAVMLRAALFASVSASATLAGGLLCYAVSLAVLIFGAVAVIFDWRLQLPDGADELFGRIGDFFSRLAGIRKPVGGGAR